MLRIVKLLTASGIEGTEVQWYKGYEDLPDVVLVVLVNEPLHRGPLPLPAAAPALPAPAPGLYAAPAPAPGPAPAPAAAAGPRVAVGGGLHRHRGRAPVTKKMISSFANYIFLNRSYPSDDLK